MTNLHRRIKQCALDCVPEGKLLTASMKLRTGAMPVILPSLMMRSGFVFCRRRIYWLPVRTVPESVLLRFVNVSGTEALLSLQHIHRSMQPSSGDISTSCRNGNTASSRICDVLIQKTATAVRHTAIKTVIMALLFMPQI